MWLLLRCNDYTNYIEAYYTILSIGIGTVYYIISGLCKHGSPNKFATVGGGLQLVSISDKIFYQSNPNAPSLNIIWPWTLIMVMLKNLTTRFIAEIVIST